MAKRAHIESPKSFCIHCSLEIAPRAKVCPHCHHFQSKIWDWLTPQTTISSVLVILAFWQAFEASESRQIAEQYSIEAENTLSIADAAMRTRVGLRSGLDELYRLKSTADNDKVRDLATSIFNRISADYESEALQHIKPRFVDTSDWPRLISAINNSPDLTEVTEAFINLRYSTNQSFRVFDFGAVEEWNKRNLNIK